MNANEFKQRFLSHYKLLYRVAYSMTGSVQDAEDLLQDLYLKLWKKREELPEEAQNQAYLVTMIRNLFYEQRRLKRLDTSGDLLENDDPPDENGLEHQFEMKEDLSEMTDLIDKLPEKERKIVKMHILEGKSYDEIEKETGLSQGNIRVIVMRAKNKLKEQFQKRNEHGETEH